MEGEGAKESQREGRIVNYFSRTNKINWLFFL
jgi:hypothetical protein